MNLPKLSEETLLRLAKEENNASVSAGKRLLPAYKKNLSVTAPNPSGLPRNKEKVAA